nr:integrase, catalytic region, zinc finger, CCHC-type, peptidase aspartic, catalytic [Tanacetum cinerariifolium]
MTGNLKLLCNFVEKFLGTVRFGNDQFAPILGYGDLVQGNVTINRVYWVKGLNHNLFSVDQFCDGDLEVAFRKLSHINFDYINLPSKKEIVIGLPKLRYVKDQQCSSCELSIAKRSSFNSKVVLSSKGRLNLLHVGTEFLNKTLNAFFKEEGIEHQTYTVKRRNRTLVEATRTMLSASQLPLFFWADAIATAYADVPSQQELDLLFGPLYDEFFNAGTNPSTTIQSTSAPSTHTNMHAEENNNDQAEEGEHVPDDEFTNPLCAPTQEFAESSSHNAGSSSVPTFNQP